MDEDGPGRGHPCHPDTFLFYLFIFIFFLISVSFFVLISVLCLYMFIVLKSFCSILERIVVFL